MKSWTINRSRNDKIFTLILLSCDKDRTCPRIVRARAHIHVFTDNVMPLITRKTIPDYVKRKIRHNLTSWTWTIVIDRYDIIVVKAFPVIFNIFHLPYLSSILFLLFCNLVKRLRNKKIVFTVCNKYFHINNVYIY